eukprot:GDKJ01019345.1.p1 GENE.GDKJ01019345.1~~GDKJ01019345.1.p1  ORF type:complete len:493 (+),score=153.78 GDKJ01019345.1:67-1545(+)
MLNKKVSLAEAFNLIRSIAFDDVEPSALSALEEKVSELAGTETQIWDSDFLQAFANIMSNTCRESNEKVVSHTGYSAGPVEISKDYGINFKWCCAQCNNSFSVSYYPKHVDIHFEDSSFSPNCECLGESAAQFWEDLEYHHHLFRVVLAKCHDLLVAFLKIHKGNSAGFGKYTENKKVDLNEQSFFEELMRKRLLKKKLNFAAHEKHSSGASSTLPAPRASLIVPGLKTEDGGRVHPRLRALERLKQEEKNRQQQQQQSSDGASVPPASGAEESDAAANSGMKSPSSIANSRSRRVVALLTSRAAIMNKMNPLQSMVINGTSESPFSDQGMKEELKEEEEEDEEAVIPTAKKHPRAKGAALRANKKAKTVVEDEKNEEDINEEENAAADEEEVEEEEFNRKPVTAKKKAKAKAATKTHSPQLKSAQDTDNAVMEEVKMAPIAEQESGQDGEEEDSHQQATRGKKKTGLAVVAEEKADATRANGIMKGRGRRK